MVSLVTSLPCPGGVLVTENKICTERVKGKRKSGEICSSRLLRGRMPPFYHQLFRIFLAVRGEGRCLMSIIPIMKRDHGIPLPHSRRVQPLRGQNEVTEWQQLRKVRSDKPSYARERRILTATLPRGKPD